MTMRNPAQTNAGSASSATSSAIVPALAEIMSRAQVAMTKNRRTATPITLAAKNAAATAGQLGYRDTGINSSGYVSYDLGNQFDNSVKPLLFDNTNPANSTTRYTRLLGSKPWKSNTVIQNCVAFNDAGQRGASVAKLPIVTDSAAPVLSVLGFSSTIYVTIDQFDGQGERNLTDFLQSTTNNGMGWLQLDLSQLGGQKKRRITFYMAQDLGINGIQLEPTATLFSEPPSPQIIAFTDSLGTSVTSGQAWDSYVSTMSDYIGVPDTVIYAAGSCGYTANPNGNGTVSSRVKRLATWYPDVCLGIFACGINDADDAAFQPAVSQAITDFFDTFKKAAGLVVLGSWAGQGNTNRTVKTAQEAKIKAAVADAKAAGKRVEFVPIMTADSPYLVPWMDSNTGFYPPGESTHWGTAGHVALGTRLAGDVVGAISNLLRS